VSCRVVSARPVRAAPAASAEQPGLRKLIVGREISMSGDITACDILMVEGNIEATLRDGKHLEITEDGHFKGSAEVDEADIAGKFEGTLTVRGRLKLRATGRIEGTISYGEIEVEAGGRLVGELKILSATAQKKHENQASARVVAGAEG
jgi:cytoskeletal protein CcmA (bactofilin family)